MLIDFKTSISFFNNNNCTDYIGKQIYNLVCDYKGSFRRCFSESMEKYVNNTSHIGELKQNHCYQLNVINNPTYNNNYNYSSILIGNERDNRNEIIIYISMLTFCVIFAMSLLCCLCYTHHGRKRCCCKKRYRLFDNFGSSYYENYYDY